MPRRPRIWMPEGIYHITLRGNNRQAIFLDATDFHRYLLELRRARNELPHRVVAFALMPNHVHLVLEASTHASLSDVMQQVNVGYTRYFNHRYHRVGQLYQGRFYSNFVDRDAYLLEVTRYVHLNPVRACLAQHPADYPWSSFRLYVGFERDPSDLIDAGRVLQLFGASPKERMEQYRQFVEGFALEEQDAWVQRLADSKLIPPSHWLAPQQVPGTSQIGKCLAPV